MDPVLDADFYSLEQLLDEGGRQLILRVRQFMEKSVAPVINHYWVREEFPHDLVGGLAGLGIAGLACQGYGCAGGSSLLDGMIAMELGRVDSSIATFMGVHGGLAMGSIYLCGSDEQKQRWLPAMARMEKIGAFALTEPDVSSGAAGGLTTTASRDGDEWVLNGQKKWIGNATFADHVIVWARDTGDNCRTRRSRWTTCASLSRTGCSRRTRSATPPRCSASPGREWPGWRPDVPAALTSTPSPTPASGSSSANPSRRSS